MKAKGEKERKEIERRGENNKIKGLN